MRKFPLTALTAALMTSACTLGPSYHGPQSAGALSPPASFARAPSPASAQTPMLARWWTGLNDPALDALEAEALAGNPDLDAALARVKQARAALGLEKANALPNAGAMAAYLHADLPGSGLGGSSSSSSALTFYNAALDASWEVDLFGGKARAREAAAASLGATQARAQDARVSLTAEVAQAYVNLRDRQQRLALAREIAACEHDRLALIEQRLAAGATSAIEVERQRDTLNRAQSVVTQIAAEQDSFLNALAALTGKAPGALDARLAAPSEVPLPPAQTAIGDPASLIARRPDIRAAERQLASATARIGVAQASRFPTLKFTGFLGLGGANLAEVFNPSSLATIAAPQLSWNFLDFGRAKNRVGQAEGAHDEAAAQYRGALVSALRDAEDALSRYGNARSQLAAADQSNASATRSLALITQRNRAGATNLIDLLDAQHQSLAARQNLTQSQAAFTASFIALQKAFGLGWE